MFDTIDDVKRANARSRAPHWFTPSTMAFFSCRIESDVIGGRYFVTSEQGPSGPRLYTVRVARDDGVIDTVGEFQAHATRKDALRAAHDAAGV